MEGSSGDTAKDINMSEGGSLRQIKIKSMDGNTYEVAVNKDVS
jgi:hypothetical protein